MGDGHKWRLVLSSVKDRELLDEAVKLLRQFPLFTDSHARVIDREGYMELLEAHEISPEQSYWKVGEGEFGLVALNAYSKYSQTWDKIMSAYSDFKAGWLACKNR